MFGATEDSQSFNYVDMIQQQGEPGHVIDHTKTFLFVSNVRHQSSGRTGAAPPSDPARNTGVHVSEITDSAITVTRRPGADDFDYTSIIQMMEYVGPTGGPNEFLVSGSGVSGVPSSNSMSVGTTLSNILVPGVPLADILKCVPFSAGVESSNAVEAQNYSTRLMWRCRAFGPFAVASIERGAGISDDDTAFFHFFFVYFKGSNWTVQQQFVTPTVRGIAETHTLATDVGNWDNAFIQLSMKVDATGFPYANECAALVYPAAATNQFKTYVEAGFNPNPPDATLSVITISNPEMIVDHANSVDGPGADLPDEGPLSGISARSLSTRDYSALFPGLGSIVYHTEKPDDPIGDLNWNARDSLGYWLQGGTSQQLVFARELGVKGIGGPWSGQGIIWPPALEQIPVPADRSCPVVGGLGLRMCDILPDDRTRSAAVIGSGNRSAEVAAAGTRSVAVVGGIGPRTVDVNVEED